MEHSYDVYVMSYTKYWQADFCGVEEQTPESLV